MTPSAQVNIGKKTLIEMGLGRIMWKLESGNRLSVNSSITDYVMKFRVEVSSDEELLSLWADLTTKLSDLFDQACTAVHWDQRPGPHVQISHSCCNFSDRSRSRPYSCSDFAG